MRVSVVCFAIALLLIATLPASSEVIFFEDFEDGTAAWFTWTASGVSNYVVWPGFTMSVEGDPYNRTGEYGFHLYQDWPSGGTTYAVVQTPPASGVVIFNCDVRPYVNGGVNNALFVSLGEVSGLVGENGHFLVGVQFGVNGSVVKRGGEIEQIGWYTPGEWCHVELVFDTDTDLFDLWVSGPGVNGTLEALDVPFRQPADGMNYIEIHDNGIGTPNDHGIDNVCLTRDGPTATKLTSWGRAKAAFTY